MAQYVGLDVSQKITCVAVIDGAGTVCWEGSCASTPLGIETHVREHAPDCEVVVFETGPLAVWHWHTLKARGLPIVCVHARHAHAAISMQLNKTDRNDALALAQMARAGWYKPVDMKSFDSHRLRLMLTVRTRIVRMRTTLYSQIRGVLKTFGTVLPPGKGSKFDRLVKEAISNDPYLEQMVGSLLGMWASLTEQLKALNRELERAARENPVCRTLMTMPGIGTLTALAFVSAIDDPQRFRRSEDVGAYLGLTPRRYQSGAVDRPGSISKCGDRMTRSLLFEAAHVLLTRIERPSALREWGRRVSTRNGPKKAKVAVARRMAVILHRMWINGREFEPFPA